MSSLVCADIHLTDSPRDEYRWKLFPWLIKQVGEHRCAEVLILGDLTVAKNYHSEMLVNELAIYLNKLAAICKVYVLAGNHDFVNPAHPFFAFTGLFKNIVFIAAPVTWDLSIGAARFLPARCQELKNFKPRDEQFIFTHATFDGSITENGTKLHGIDPKPFKAFKGMVYSGDIHVPQRIGKNIVYVGAPYRIRFGDVYEPRVLLLDRSGQTDLRFPTVTKHSIRIRHLVDLDFELYEQDMACGDQVKVRVQLPRRELPDWPTMRKQIVEWAQKNELELYGPELELYAEKPKKEAKSNGVIVPEDVVRDYAKLKRFDEKTEKIGLRLLKEAQK